MRRPMERSTRKVPGLDETMHEFFERCCIDDMIPFKTPAMKQWDRQLGRIVGMSTDTVTVSFNGRLYVLNKQTGVEHQYHEPCCCCDACNTLRAVMPKV